MKTATHTLSANRIKYWSALLATPLLASAPACLAQESAVEPAEETPFVSGTLAFVVDTHFVSYGFDVWGAGNKWKDPLFHPSLELSFDLGGGFNAILGSWWDVNNNTTATGTSIGGDKVQEQDVWVGLGYSAGDFSFTALYQEWMYAGQSERIVDLKVAYSHFLSPSVTFHFRTDSELPGNDDGLAAVLGIAPGKTFEKLGDLSVSVPVSVAFETDNFHGGDSGFSFASIGASAGLPLKFITKGDWTLTAGVTYFFTNDDVIPANPKDDFLTGSAGITLAF